MFDLLELQIDFIIVGYDLDTIDLIIVEMNGYGIIDYKLDAIRLITVEIGLFGIINYSMDTIDLITVELGLFGDWDTFKVTGCNCINYESSIILSAI